MVQEEGNRVVEQLRRFGMMTEDLREFAGAVAWHDRESHSEGPGRRQP
jgi:hypothetical protein